MYKIAISHSKFPDKVHDILSVQKTKIRSKMNSFERAIEDEIKKTYFELIVKIIWSGPHSYKRAELLSWYISSSITDIINISIDTSTFPKKIKEAHVRPLLKNTYLPKLTEKLQVCILFEFHFQNLRKR